MPNETVSVGKNKPVYLSFQGENVLMARFKEMKDGQVRVLRLDCQDKKFQISDRPPYDFDYSILNDPKWMSMPAHDFYRILFDNLMKADLQIIINY